MKKILAMSGAAALGATGLVAAAAAPATAAPLPACQNADDHDVSPTATSVDDWYMPCMPQFGLNDKPENEITILAADAFPAGFDLSLATVTSDFDDAAAGAYTGETVSSGFIGGFSATTSPTDTLVTNANIVFAIAGVTRIDASELPAACTGSYNAAYRIDYVPREVTIAQTIAGTEYRYRGTVGGDPLYFGVNLDDANPGKLIGGADLCEGVGSFVTATQWDHSFFTPAGMSLGPGQIMASGAASITPFLPLYAVAFDAQGGTAVPTADVLDGGTASAPTAPTREGYDFVGWFTAPTGGEKWDFDSAVAGDTTLYARWTPTLAATGAETGPAGAIGLGMLLLGGAAVAFPALRRRARARA